ALACLLAMTQPKDRLDGHGGHADQSSRVQAAVGYFAPTDFALLHDYYCRPTKGLPPLDPFKLLALRFFMEKWLDRPPSKVPEPYTKASPAHYAHKDAAPILLLHGTKDVVVPLEQSEQFVTKMRKAGGNVTLLTFDGAPHDFDEIDDMNARLAAIAA